MVVKEEVTDNNSMEAKVKVKEEVMVSHRVITDNLISNQDNNTDRWINNQEVHMEVDMANNNQDNNINNLTEDISSKVMEHHMVNKVMEVVAMVNKVMVGINNNTVDNKVMEDLDRAVPHQEVMLIQGLIMVLHHHQCHTDLQSNKTLHLI